jgi:CrcB protein
LREWLHLLLAWGYQLLTHKLLLLALGGAAGTLARYGLSRWLNELAWARGFPLGTFTVNMTGSFILGVAAVVILERLPPVWQPAYLLIGTGFCGGFTTFSTFELETFRLVRDGSYWMALANVGGSVVVGFAGVVLAVIVVEAIL